MHQIDVPRETAGATVWAVGENLMIDQDTMAMESQKFASEAMRKDERDFELEC